MNQVNQIEVLIDGKIYTISGEEDAGHIQRVAQFVNEKMQAVRGIPGYRRLDEEYQRLLLNLNLADAYFKEKETHEQLSAEAEEQSRELYAVKHDLVSIQMKLENALRQQETVERRCEEWKNKYEELKKNFNERR